MVTYNIQNLKIFTRSWPEMVSEYIILLPYFNNMYNFCWSIALQNNCYVYVTA